MLRRSICTLMCPSPPTPASFTMAWEQLSKPFGEFTSSHVATFNRDGIVCLPRFVSDEIAEFVKASMVAQIEAEAYRRSVPAAAAGGEEASLSTFTTGDHCFDDSYFLESGDKVRYFLEPGQTQVSVGSINKVAHGLHTDNGVFQAFSANPSFGSIARKLGRMHPSVVQSMYILKAPRVGGAVVAHQDTTWIYTRPHSCVAFWVALDDCTIQNSCLLALKGSHRTFTPVSAQCTLDDGDKKSTLHGTLPAVKMDEMEPLECPKGSLVVFDGATVHGSTGNLSDMQRHAYVIHVVDDNCCWGERNWFGKHLARLSL